jgi:capsular exopolysaccharide synthesis family protein
MGRIDEALRRAGASPFQPQAASTAGTGVFVAPWMFDDHSCRPELQLGHQGEPGARQIPALSQEFDREEPEAVARLGDTHPLVPVPLIIEAFKPAWRQLLTIGSDADPMLVDQFRRLAATLIHAQREQRLKSVMITSADPDDGKTLTALNLALVLSESYRRRVLLIEGDLRRPVLAKAVNLVEGVGLSEAIKAVDERKPVLIRLTSTLALLPAGRPDPDPLSGLTSIRMQRLLHDAAEHFDWVIVDTPPLGSAADAGLLCPMLDAALLVVRAGRTAYADVQRTIDALGRERLLGVVLNGVDGHSISGYDGYQPDRIDPQPSSRG